MKLSAIFGDVIACDMPTGTVLSSRIQANDFLDCYRVKAVASPRFAAETITEFPAWAGFLLVIRRIVTSPFGLSQDGPDAVDKVGAFPVEYESDDELLAGFNDKHLDFRVCVVASGGCVYLATWVRPHNVGGRMYLRLIMPFHVLIARDALVRVARKSHAR